MFVKLSVAELHAYTEHEITSTIFISLKYPVVKFPLKLSYFQRATTQIILHLIKQINL